jgi:hypothetical protein
MFVTSWPAGSLPATTWHFTHCHLPNKSLPAATVVASVSGRGSNGYGTPSIAAK